MLTDVVMPQPGDPAFIEHHVDLTRVFFSATIPYEKETSHKE